MTPNSWPNGDPNAVIHEILARPEYRDSTAVSVHDYSPLFWLLQRIIDFFTKLLKPVFNGSHLHSLGIAAVVVVYALVLGAVIYLVLALVEALAGRPSIRDRRGLGPAQALETTSPQALRREAAAAYGRGEFGRAIALLFRAALFALDGAALVAFDAARTPGEYRRLVGRALPTQAPPFDDLSRRFVRASFGATAARPEDYDAAEAAYAAFAPNDFLPPAGASHVKRVPILESIVVVLAIVVMAVVGVLQGERNRTAIESYSTYDFDSGGFRAWYQLLAREGLRSNRFEERAAFLDRYTRALVIGASPLSLDILTAATPADGATVASWVRDGGRLLIVGNGPFASFASFDLHLANAAGPSAKRGMKPFVAPALARLGVRDVGAREGARLSLGKGQTALLSDRRGVLVERHALGHGEVVQLVDGTLLRNADIGTPDRARLAFALAKLVAGSDSLAFDETIHGYFTPEHWWQVLPRRFVLAILFGGIVLLVAFTGAAIRLGPPRVLAPPPAPTSAEYLDALSALMERARAAAASLAQALRSTRQMLGARFGVPEDLPAALVAERIERQELRQAFLELDALSREAHPGNASVVRGLTLAFRLREEYAPHAAGR